MSLPPLRPESVHARVRVLLADASAAAVRAGLIAEPVAAAQVPIERPRDPRHGDLATNLCFSLARGARTNPRALAERFCACITAVDEAGLVARAEVAGPGFVNLTLADAAWRAAIGDVLRAGPRWGDSDGGSGQRVLVEFVSANPTGPLHVGHGRGAVLGDTIAALLRATGCDVATEYYINNVGNQVAMLGRSVWHWWREPAARAAALALWADDEAVPFPDAFPAGFPSDGYRGAYVAACADEFARDPAIAPASAAWDDDRAWASPDNPTGRADNRAITVRAWQAMQARITADLDGLGVRFDRWFSERALHGLDGGEDRVRGCAERLRAAAWAAEADAVDDDDSGRALCFRGTRDEVPKAFRDTKDRVIVRSDGRPTYFAADIAYHDDKIARGFDQLINVLGADHHGYVPRLKGVLCALGEVRRAEGDPDAARFDGERLEVPLVQMVSLVRAGVPVPMGKRSGEFVTLRDVIDEVTTPGNPGSGRDAVRFLFLLRKADAQLEFDLDVARRASMDNPVYYVQYGHARLASILARAGAEGRPLRTDEAARGDHLAALQLDDERALALAVAEFPDVVARAARAREPHQIAYWLMDLCKAFHGYYSHHRHDARIISVNDGTTQARLALVAALKQSVGRGLALIGVAAPDRMAELDDDGEPTA